ncbi:MAG: outer membrane protein assembly factor BamA, partial [Bacteroidia bacterium]|nr:outer membrane protein assembly factor BamA [Bacteroidia bacterium]
MKEDLVALAVKKLVENMLRKLLLLIAFVSIGLNAQSQIVVGGTELELDYNNPREFKIGGITVSGIRYLDEEVLKTISGLRVGQTIKVPGDELAGAVRKLWKQGLLSDVAIRITNIQADVIFFDLMLTERPRLSRFAFSGVKKSEADKLRDKVDLVKGKVITENLKRTTTTRIKQYYIDKGYLNVEVGLVVETDTTIQNSELFRYTIKKKNRVKINEIFIEGNKELSDGKIKRKMKDTKTKKWYRIFKASKYIDENFEKDQDNIIAHYNAKGFRDARIASSDMKVHDKKTVNLYMTIAEGNKYYFRDINWLGNTKYTSEQLTALMGIKRGEIYNQDRLDRALFMSQNGTDITSLYMDDGYLFFNMQPYEVLVEGDSIDLEIRITEGKQARVNRVTVIGNTKTNDKVIMREIRTKPGKLFSRSDIIRSQRELAQLGYFNNEALGVNPKPNPDNGTVDIEYVVEERPSDQVELSGGYGAGQFVGTLGLSFNNFSAKNFFKKGTWRPLPAGDGQRLSLRAQSNGRQFQSYNVSFSEPWLGGKKPISFTVSAYTSIQSNGLKRGDDNRQSITINGLSVSLGKRLRVPDDFFSIYSTVSYQHYTLQNYNNTFLFSDGEANNLSFTQSLSRNSVDDPLYPRRGSSFSTSVQFTPPFSLFDVNDFT